MSSLARSFTHPHATATAVYRAINRRDSSGIPHNAPNNWLHSPYKALDVSESEVRASNNALHSVDEPVRLPVKPPVSMNDGLHAAGCAMQPPVARAQPAFTASCATFRAVHRPRGTQQPSLVIRDVHTFLYIERDSSVRSRAHDAVPSSWSIATSTASTATPSMQSSRRPLYSNPRSR